ncbi:hypothetical protein ANO14919_013260 [Xylariales sp. No.14919]|nr:hypothetical protein ANO14919_013260 [Xylariales sp. No.14919]
MSSPTTSTDSTPPSGGTNPGGVTILASDPGWACKKYTPGYCHCHCKKRGHETLQKNLFKAKDGSGRWVCGGCWDRAGVMGNCR